jgi:hypothetical protein
MNFCHRLPRVAGARLQADRSAARLRLRRDGDANHGRRSGHTAGPDHHGGCPGSGPMTREPRGIMGRMAIALQPFGRTGHQSTRVIFGAAALSRVDQSLADHALEVLLEHGINHLDVAASYGDAELRIAPWLKRYPDRFFLATKTGRRTAMEAREELQRSLDRLGVDHVDLWQLHNLVDPIEWDTPSGSPATARRSPPPTAAAWSASTSTRCCCRTTS